MIFCVEDDANIRKLIVYTLGSTGFEAEGYEEGKSFFEAVEKEIPELVILDIMLPGMDGMEILAKLKQSERTKDIPVIMATAKGAEYDKVQGLDAGADDYITKPFGMLELVSRVKAVLRRAKKYSENEKESTKDRIEIKGICMNLKKHEVHAGENVISLTLKEYELLKRLMENPDIVLTRDSLLTEIWGYDFFGETRTVDVHIRTLRQKLGKYGDKIETVRGVGYRVSR